MFIFLVLTVENLSAPFLLPYHERLITLRTRFFVRILLRPYHTPHHVELCCFASPKPQEKRLKGLGATIPPHAVMQAKRDREWREFLERRTGDPSGVATVRKEKHRFGDEVSFTFSRELVLFRLAAVLPVTFSLLTTRYFFPCASWSDRCESGLGVCCCCCCYCCCCCWWWWWWWYFPIAHRQRWSSRYWHDERTPARRATNCRYDHLLNSTRC